MLVELQSSWLRQKSSSSFKPKPKINDDVVQTMTTMELMNPTLES